MADRHLRHDWQLVVEAVSGEEQAKLEVFAKFDSIVTGPQAILASNTSLFWS